MIRRVNVYDEPKCYPSEVIWTQMGKNDNDISNDVVIEFPLTVSLITCEMKASEDEQLKRKTKVNTL